MTIAEEIQSRVEKLPPKQQAALLSLLDSMGPPSPPRARAGSKRRSRTPQLDAALRAAAGIWKDRTDLPADTVETARELKRRLMRQHPPVDKRKLHPALRAIVGMWKDRTDLPKDGAAASVVLRRRVMGRADHA